MSTRCSAVAGSGALRLELLSHEILLPGDPRYAERRVIAAALLISLLVVLGTLALVTMFVRNWDRQWS